MSQKLQFTLVTGRTVDQGVGKERGKGSKEYFDTASICFLDLVDLEKLGIKSGTNVKLTTKFGSVIVKALQYPRGSINGIVFMPCGLWANAICGDDTYTMGMPLFKGFPVEVEPAPDQPVLSLKELMKKEYGR